MQNGGGVQPWWHGSVLYQLYVRSWQDADGDGYGDLPGLISRFGGHEPQYTFVVKIRGT